MDSIGFGLSPREWMYRHAVHIMHGVMTCCVLRGRAYYDFTRNPLKMVRPTGIEPVAYSLGGCCSIRLSYERVEDM